MFSCAHEAFVTPFQHFLLALFGARAAGCCEVLVTSYRLSCSGWQLAIGLPQDLLIVFPARLDLFSFIELVGRLSGHF